MQVDTVTLEVTSSSDRDRDRTWVLEPFGRKPLVNQNFTKVRNKPMRYGDLYYVVLSLHIQLFQLVAYKLKALFFQSQMFHKTC